MSINFPSNPSNNQIFVANNGTNWIFSNTKNVWSVVSQSTYQVAVTTANTWSNPNTGNTFGMYQTSGSKYIVTNPTQSLSYNAVSIGTQFLGRNVATDVYNQNIKIPRSLDANTDYILRGIANNNSIFAQINQSIVVEGVSYNFGSAETDASFYTFNLYNVPDTYGNEIVIESGNTINVSVTYRSPQVWFDPEELGFTDFRAAKLDYRAYVDGIDGFTEINTIHYAKPIKSISPYYSDFTSLYVYNSSQKLLPIRTTSNNQTAFYQSAYFTELWSNEHGNKLYYINYTDPVDYLPGNLFIQWAGTVWTGPAN